MANQAELARPLFDRLGPLVASLGCGFVPSALRVTGDQLDPVRANADEANNSSNGTLGRWMDMPFMPLAVLPMWKFGLLSLASLFGGGYIVYEWWQGAIVSTGVLVAGIAMLVVTLLFTLRIVQIFDRSTFIEKTRDEVGYRYIAGVHPRRYRLLTKCNDNF